MRTRNCRWFVENGKRIVRWRRSGIGGSVQLPATLSGIRGQFTIDFLSGVQDLGGVIDRVPPDTTTVFIWPRLLVDPLS
jgi:hypothetical protein